MEAVNLVATGVASARRGVEGKGGLAVSVCAFLAGASLSVAPIGERMLWDLGRDCRMDEWLWFLLLTIDDALYRGCPGRTLVGELWAPHGCVVWVDVFTHAPPRTDRAAPCLTNTQVSI